MRYSIIYALIALAVISASLYVGYTLMSIGRHVLRQQTLIISMECVYSRGICISQEPIKVESLKINNTKINVIIIDDVALPTHEKVFGNCTKPPCITVNTLKNIKIVSGSVG